MKTKKLGGGSEAGVGPGVSRRRFLRTTGILAGAGALIFASFEFGIKRVIQMARAPVAKSGSPLGRLSEQEMETMMALLEVLVPVELWRSRKNMTEMVNQASENDKGVLKEYKTGVSLLDTRARAGGVSQGFAKAPIEDRQRVLESIMWRYDGARRGSIAFYANKIEKGLERLLHSEPERRFRDLVIRDLLERFYTGETAWRLVGYSNYPGVPGNPRGYVHPLNSE